MKGKIHKKKIAIPIYFGYLEIIVAKNLAKAALQNPKYDLPTNEDYNKYGAFVKKRKNDRGSEIYGVFVGPYCTVRSIVHEAVHIKNLLFLDIGHSQDPRNDETEAYLMGWITGEIQDFYKKVKKKIQ